MDSPSHFSTSLYAGFSRSGWLCLSNVILVQRQTTFDVLHEAEQAAGHETRSALLQEARTADMARTIIALVVVFIEVFLEVLVVRLVDCYSSKGFNPSGLYLTGCGSNSSPLASIHKPSLFIKPIAI